jgi:hypothetical protein
MNNNRKNRNILTHENTKDIVRGERLNNRDFIWKIITIIVLLEIILIAPVISSFTNTVIIKNTGEISANTIVARSGSPQDIQAAVDAVIAAGGGTVYVPEGNFTFDFSTPTSWSYGVIVYGGVNVIGAGADKTILRMTRNPTNDHSVIFALDGSNGKPIRISGIFFKGYVYDTEDYATLAIEIDNAKDFRIDHCKFEDFSGNAIGVGEKSRGVIDHCNFDNPYKLSLEGAGWGYGIIVWGDGQTWESLDHYLGKYEDVPNTVAYIEDCTFKRCRHSIAANAGGYYVARHCTVTNPNPEHFPQIETHGATGGPGLGARGFEAYDNIIIGCEYYAGGWHSVAFDYRGGGGVVFNNTIIDCEYGVRLSREPGQLTQCVTKYVWIWGNTVQKQNAPTAGTLLHNYGDFTEGVDYFLYAKSGYTPYPYPHPLTMS